ncbi:MAG: DUF4268 domain-containing protein [Phycisphaerae bacterium]|nr:DUF4268 domain-containing protein [Phycisphaerae bacterium]
MLRCELGQLRMKRLDKVPFADAKIQERYDFQKLILQSPNAFFEEIGEPNLIVIGSEVRPNEVVADRADIVALDAEDGSLVVVELKRGRDKYQLLQALHYAAMLAEWSAEDVIRHYAKCKDMDQENLEEASEDLREQDVELDDINRSQRCILVAEDYEPDVLITANWLAEEFGVRVSCVRARAVRDQHVGEKQGDVVYLELQRIVPAPAIHEFFGGRARKPGRGSGGGVSAAEQKRKEANRRFWTELREALLQAGHSWAENRTPSGDHWFPFSVGRGGIHVTASFAQGGRLRAEVIMETGDRETNKQMFDDLQTKSDRIQSLVTGDLSWERLDERKSSRVAVYRECDRDRLESDGEYRQDAIDWLIKRMCEFREVAQKHLV